ncbi:MAG: hypothetical protein Q9225_001215 [Loekoesia sp. 1 TL-2023]
MIYLCSLQASITVVVLVRLVCAFTAYTPKCSDPPDDLNYLSPPRFRGTLDIGWSCFAVVFTCTWAVQHLCVPIQPEPAASTALRADQQLSIVGRIRRSISRLKTPEASFLATKFKWMLTSIAMPEFVLGKALAERWAAQESHRQSAVDGWTTMHAFFANMRGFVLRFRVNAVKTPLVPSKPDELGRSLHRLRQEPILDGVAPYYEQDLKRAEIIESIHCRQKCRATHKHSNDSIFADHCQRDVIANSDTEKDNLPGQPNSSLSRQASLTMNSPKKVPPSFAPHSLSRRHTAEPLTLLTPTTLVKSPRTPSYSPALSGLSPSSPHNRDSAQFHSTTASPSTLDNPANPNPITGAEKKAPDLPDHPTWTATWALNSMQIHYAQQHGIIPSSPFVPLEALKDRSKGDSFIKGFAILQITALVIQIIVRSFQNLATTLLEVNVLAFAACAIVTYILLWHKPQDVKIPIYIDIPTILTRDQIIQLAARAPVATLLINDFWLHGVSVRTQSDNIFPWTPGIRIRPPFIQDLILVSPVALGIGGGGMISGAVHFAAWNFHFPTPVERLLWRISCTVLIFFPLLGIAFYWTMQQFAKKSGAVDAKLNQALRPICYVIGLVYLLARGYLIVEVFRALAYPEPSIFQQVNWPSLIPHLD